ncbi:MAG TPA: HAD family phosphatase [Chlamydiales bacterium]
MMKWTQDFQLFLFDFDGLLVDTESMHHQAYVLMLEAEGFKLDWSHAKFCSVAHLNATALKEALYAEFPKLDPDWKRLYATKKRLYEELIATGKIGLMPGVEKLLIHLAKQDVRRCVVTNSFYPQIEAIRNHIPALQTIPHWITREHYEKAKPDPEGYLLAIQRHGKPRDRIVGFEDSIRGLQALMGTTALPVLVCASHHPLMELAGTAVIHYESFEKIPERLM